MKFVRITDRESLCREGIMRMDIAGHGVVAGMYRRPELKGGQFLYRLYKEGVNLNRVEIKKLMELHLGPGSGSIINAEWFRLACQLCDQHNMALRTNRDAADDTVANAKKELEQMEERLRDEKKNRLYARIDASDVFQNDIFLDIDDSGRLVQSTYRRPEGE